MYSQAEKSLFMKNQGELFLDFISSLFEYAQSWRWSDSSKRLQRSKKSDFQSIA